MGNSNKGNKNQEIRLKKKEEKEMEEKEIKKMGNNTTLENKEKIKINLDSISAFSTTEKQMWRLILSNLDYIDLPRVARVCKNFYLILKKDAMFWMLLTRNESKRYGIEMPQNCDNWKVYYHSTFLLNWEKNNKNFNFPNPKTLVSLVASGWYACRTSSILMENILYGFKVLELSYPHLVIGFFSFI